MFTSFTSLPVKTAAGMFSGFAPSKNQKSVYTPQTVGLAQDTVSIRFGQTKAKSTIPTHFNWGTAGFRPGRAITRREMIALTNAYADYVIKANTEKKAILVAGDRRPNSIDLLPLAVKVLSNRFASAGIPVIYCPDPVATPVISYAVPNNKAFGAFVLTASHNPPWQGGIKNLIHTGANAPVEITNELMASADKHYFEDDWKTEDAAPLMATPQKGNFNKAYFDALELAFPFEKMAQVFKRAGMTILFDAHYGAGVPLGEFLKQKDLPVEIRRAEEVIIPPEEEEIPKHFKEDSEPRKDNLGEVIRDITEDTSRKTIGVATDGDGDRGALIAEGGRYITSEDMMALLIKDAANKKREGLIDPDSIVVMNHGSSAYMTARLIAEGLLNPGDTPFITAVGFKHIGEKVAAFTEDPTQPKVILGIEANNGGAASSYAPVTDKDAALPICTALKLIAEQIERGEYQGLANICDQMRNETPQKFHTVEQKLTFDDGSNKPKTAMHKLSSLRDREKIGLLNHFLPRDMYADLKRTDTHKQHMLEHFETTDGVKVFFKDQEGELAGWFLVRPSGTEAALRVQYEGIGKNKEIAARRAMGIEKALNGFLSQTSKVSIKQKAQEDHGIIS